MADLGFLSRALSPRRVQTCPTHQVSVENLPDVKGYASSDAFIKHPTVEGLFKVYVVLDAPDGHKRSS